MGQVSSYTLPVPHMGINLIDGIDQLAETDARGLVNAYPTGSILEIRKGYDLEYLASADDPVQTVATLTLATGVSQIISAADNKLFIGNGAGSTNITGATTPTSNLWQTVVFNHILYLVNGEDNGQFYNGTGTAGDMTWTGGATPAIDTLVYVTTYKQRLFFLVNNSLSLWYGGLKTSGAAATPALVEYQLSYWFKLGGYAMMCGSWSSNLGDQSADLFWVLSSEGEILIFQGSDPASDFVLRSRYVIGRPLGRRSVVQVENDVWFLTDQGVVPMTTLMQVESSTAANMISRKINPLIRRSAKSWPDSALWSGVYYSNAHQVWINYPVTVSNTRRLVINMETGAWTTYRFLEGGASLCLCTADGLVYAGSSAGNVYELDQGYSDNGNPISYIIELGFNFFGKRGVFKAFKDVRPIMRTAQGSLTLQLDIDTDFRPRTSYATITTPSDESPVSSAWDEAIWDVSPWGDEDRILFDRYGLAGTGHCGALRIAGSLENTLLEFNAFEIRYEDGGQV